jgi:hypothetical protein
MKVQSNVRAGKGGASGVGKNSATSTSEVQVEIASPAPVYTAPVARCVGI